MTGAGVPGLLRRRWPELVAALLPLALFAQVAGFGFLRYDDNVAVTENPAVAHGLTAAAVLRAFATLQDANWIPVTALSHALDVQLFGMRPAGHHLVSLALHALNAVLLYRLLFVLTAMRGRSLLVAALFAAHPLHVESVAWVAERKDVLMLAFGLASLLAWAGWARRGGAGRYALALLLFALGLAAKPLLFTLPLLMLVLDFWPLGRLRPGPAGAGGGGRGAVLLEKVPFLALALAAGGVAVWAQRGAMVLDDRIGAAAKGLHALGALAWYLGKTVLPAGLAAFYPYPLRGEPAGRALAGLALLAAGTVAAWAWRRRRPWLAAGWLLFLVPLAPVLGFPQVGEQAFADRYAYLPLTGLFLAAAWGLPELAGGSRRARAALVAAGCAAVACLGAAASLQARHWRDDEALFTHALAVTEGNYVAHNNLGALFFRRGETARAAEHFREAVRLAPRNAKPRANLGFVLLREQRAGDAEAEFRAAIAGDPADFRAWRGLGLALQVEGRREEALAAYRESLRLRPADPRTAALLRGLESGRPTAGEAEGP